MLLAKVKRCSKLLLIFILIGIYAIQNVPYLIQRMLQGQYYKDIFLKNIFKVIDLMRLRKQ
jgi:hypothetical protein